MNENTDLKFQSKIIVEIHVSKSERLTRTLKLNVIAAVARAVLHFLENESKGRLCDFIFRTHILPSLLRR